jgi:Concanavalin A-like lectin/glucanases superfamily
MVKVIGGRLCMIAVALAGVFALAQKADAAWVLHWGAHMNERSGTVMNDFVANRDGQHEGVGLGVLGPAGKGTAYHFDGTTSAAWVAAAGLEPPGTRSVRVSVWIKPDRLPAASPEPDIVKRGYSASSPGLYKVEYLSNRHASCGFKGTLAGVGHVTGGPELDDGLWHRIVCTKTSTRITLNVDGQTVASKAIAVGSINMPNDDLVIGAYRRGSPNFKGDIDEVRIEYFN